MKNKINYIATVVFAIIFTAFTWMVTSVDVGKIGPNGTSIGFSTINKAVHDTLGTSDLWYNITEVLGVIALLTAFCFGILALVNFIKHKSLIKMDRDLFALMAFYIAVIIAYIAFEAIVINYRPVLEDGEVAASYPSSHVMLVTCIMVTAFMQFGYRIKKDALRVVMRVAAIIMALVTIVGRLLSGEHWLTDVIGSLLLCATLIAGYTALAKSSNNEIESK